jgi:hypothetical protein
VAALVRELQTPWDGQHLHIWARSDGVLEESVVESVVVVVKEDAVQIEGGFKNVIEVGGRDVAGPVLGVVEV